MVVEWFIVFASALVGGVVSLFRDNEGDAIMASPSYCLKPVLVLLRMFFSSLWPLLVIIVPALIAIMRVFPFDGFGFGLALLGSVVLAFVAVQLAILLLLGIGAFLGVLGIFSRSRLTFSTVSLFLLITLLIGKQFQSVNLVNFFQARLLSADVPDFSPILDQFAYFPSHFVSMIIYHAEQGAVLMSLIPFGDLVALALAFLILFISVVKYHLFYWQVAQEHVVVKRPTFSRLNIGRPLSGVSRPTSALLIKEFILFVRNARGMLWLGFILVIWAIQSSSSFFLRHGLGDERVSGGDLPLVTTAIQLALIAYFISMFALRFAFPSFSEEKKAGWIVESSPLPLRGVFLSKWYFFCGLFSVLAVVFALLNGSIIGLTAVMMPVVIMLTVVVTVTITTFALSLGAIFPNPETDDPEVLSTSLPGLSFIILSLCYGGLGGLVFYEYLSGEGFLPVMLFVATSLLSLPVLTLYAARALRRQYLV